MSIHVHYRDLEAFGLRRDNTSLFFLLPLTIIHSSISALELIV